VKQSYLHIIIWLALFVCLISWSASPPVSRAGQAAPVSAPVSAPVPESSENNHNEEADDGSDGTESRQNVVAAVIGPGRAVLELGPTGRWIGFSPVWSAGNSVIAGGGFVVLVAGENGEIIELANTAIATPQGLRPNKEAADLGPVQEGVVGGVRYPLPQSDDDGDGREDEDRLDGVDNDKDGKIDEDYAAAGDQMIVLSYEALDEDGKSLLQFHQECYTWTHPHIDCMVAMKLTVRNTSKQTIKDVCIGTIIERPRGFSVSTQDLVSPQGTGEVLVSKGILLGDPDRTAVAAVCFAEPVKKNLSWLTGVISADRRLADLVQAYLAADKETLETPAAGERETGDSDSSSQTAPSGSNTQIAYGVSPLLGDLEPGQEIVVYAALLAIQSVDGADRAIEDAYRTVIGDGIQRMIPAPLSIKRRTIRGTYAVQGSDQENTPASVTITLENTRGHGFGPDDISYLTGIDFSRAEITETWRGDMELKITGELYEEIAGTKLSTELHGRLRNGELFDVLLTPVDPKEQAIELEGVSEEQYWARPGRLDEALLSGSPNPFRDATTIYYEVPSSIADESGSVLSFASPVEASLKIYNVAGRLVSTLVDRIVSPGAYKEQWNAMDVNGNAVASGVYYIKLQIGQKHVTKRLIQLK
jgi:hypothetical protein